MTTEANTYAHEPIYCGNDGKYFKRRHLNNM